MPSHEVNINGTFNVLRAAKEGQVGRVVYAASSSAYGDTEVLPKVESMTAAAEIALRAAEAGGRILLQHFLRRLRAGDGVRCATSTCTVRGRIRRAPYSGVLSLFMKAVLDRTGADHFRRRRAVARLHLRGGRGGAEPEGGARQGRLRQGVQRRQRRPDHAQPGLGAAAENGRRRDPAESTARRARATCAIRRPTPRSPCAIWATRRATPSKKACGSRWSGTATTDDSPRGTC